MVLQNYIILEEGIPAALHFTDHAITAREITDPVTQETKIVNALVFTVDELNGRPVSAHYSTVSEKHALTFQPYLAGKKYTGYTFVITQVGKGFRRDYQVQVIPRR